MQRFLAAAAVILVTGSISEAAKEQTGDAAYRAALKKGYTGEKAKCYADVSRQYYKPGTLTVPGRKTHGWHVELWDRCRISR